MSTLLNKIASAQREAGERVVMEDLHAKGLADIVQNAPLEQFAEWVEQWATAYPVDVFPEPDMSRVRDVLTAAGLSLDQVSASNMRHVITRVRDELKRLGLNRPK